MHRTVGVLASLALAGCVGSLTDKDGAQPDARRGPDATVVDIKAILRQWSGCMTLANFQAANMAASWSLLTTNDNKQCQNCHAQGQFGFIASSDETAFFDGISQHSALMIMYFTVDVPTKTVVVNTTSFKSANTKPGHPRFNATANIGMTALATFHTATAMNTACDAPRMID